MTEPLPRDITSLPTEDPKRYALKSEIVRLLERRRLTIARLGEILGIQYTYLARTLNGSVGLGRRSKLPAKVSSFLNRPVSQLFPLRDPETHQVIDESEGESNGSC